MSLFGKKKTTKKKVKKVVKRKPVRKKVKKRVVKRKPVKKIKRRSVKKKIVKPKRKIVRKPKKKIKKAKAVKKVKKVVKKAPKVVIIPRLDEEKAFEMLKKSRIPTVPYVFLKKEKDIPLVKKLGFPCVLKVVGKEIMHKTEVSGIEKNVNFIPEATDVFSRLMKINKAEKVIAQKQVDGLELIIGAKSNDQFGHVVSIGIGGIFVEVLKDVSFRIAPISRSDAEKMVKELKGFDILNGFRGSKPINLNSLYDLLVKVGNFVIKNKIKEMDLNPVFCDERGCLIGDVRIVK